MCLVCTQGTIDELFFSFKQACLVPCTYVQACLSDKLALSVFHHKQTGLPDRHAYSGHKFYCAPDYERRPLPILNTNFPILNANFPDFEHKLPDFECKLSRFCTCVQNRVPVLYANLRTKLGNSIVNFVHNRETQEIVINFSATQNTLVHKIGDFAYENGSDLRCKSGIPKTPRPLFKDFFPHGI
uniref:Uncharacterized protein n=1 Tax=Cacopsylla melanoneura TaxID=428564 RepID=A0A8D8Z6A3_9HEMI